MKDISQLLIERVIYAHNYQATHEELHSPKSINRPVNYLDHPLFQTLYSTSLSRTDHVQKTMRYFIIRETLLLFLDNSTFRGVRLNPYLKQYKWSNIFAMMRNLRSEPANCPDDFSDRLVVITGATSGIGFATARKYASRGANLLFVNRNADKSDELCESLRKEYDANCDYILADFSRLSDIHSTAHKLAALDQKIDVLIHNAGVYVTKKTFTLDNIETVFQTNYLSTFILNYLLRDKFQKQNSGRILYVNSEAHRFAVWGLHLDDLSWERHRYTGLLSYGVAKMAQLLSMVKFSEYFAGTGVTINAMHPGNVQTSSGQNNNEIYKFFKRVLVDSNARPISIASESLYYLGVSKDLDQVSGRFFNLTTQEDPAPPALDTSAAEKLWDLSIDLGGLHEN